MSSKTGLTTKQLAQYEDNQNVTGMPETSIKQRPAPNKKEKNVESGYHSDVEDSETQVHVDEGQAFEAHNPSTPPQPLVGVEDLAERLSRVAIFQLQKSFFWSQHSTEEWDIYNDDSNAVSRPQEELVSDQVNHTLIVAPKTPIFFAFQGLPSKIRARVWQLHSPFPVPRVLEAGYHMRRSLQYKSPLLSICPESRSYFQSRYKRVFSDKTSEIQKSCMYLNPQTDTLLVDLSIKPLEVYVNELSNVTLASLRHLALAGCHVPFDWYGGIPIDRLRPLLRFRKLERISLVVCDAWNGGPRGHVELYSPFTSDIEGLNRDLEYDELASLIVDEAVGSRDLSLQNVRHLQHCVYTLNMVSRHLLGEDLNLVDWRAVATSALEHNVWMLPEIVITAVRRVSPS